jgi:diphthamide biosynthesis protein 2
LLQKSCPGKFFFIIGETSYGLCCADDIAALHLQAHIIIRVGNTCLTRNKQLPVFYLHENKILLESDASQLSKNLNEIKEKSINSKIYVLLEILK